MPKRSELQNIILIGAGPIVIGQACEFDYSGTQACRALREEGYRVVLINSNPATIMTDPETADSTYIEPVTPNSVRAVIESELEKRPGENFALLPTMGGQVALNVALALSDEGYLQKKGIELLGAKPEVIRKAEDRLLFRDAMIGAGIECARSAQVSSVEEGLVALSEVGLPAILRPSFTLGGTGGGVVYEESEFVTLLSKGLEASPAGTVLIEESLLGWKEFELELVRDNSDNVIVVCSIENIDPMGVHTGDSITVAPALTLTDKELQEMRNTAITCMREIGVDTGGSNVQFAVDPKNGRQILIEMNPRVSRSSALASKATGFPIARVAAKLAVGYTLDEITNEITGTTPASFEPTIDYVVTKIPRFDFSKFPQATPQLTTAMKSVGEVMAVGRNFAQSMQKALRSLEIGLDGFDSLEDMKTDALLAELGKRVPMRILLIAEALRRELSTDQIHERCGVDPWFIDQVGETLKVEKAVKSGELSISDAFSMLRLKKAGLSDARIGQLAGYSEADIRAYRRSQGIAPVIKRIDSCAAEFRSRTDYMYSSYEGDGTNFAECEADISNRRKVVVIGSGPNRIGQGIEFDYCCVHACFGLAELGFETIMINCNPETVSTDFDTSDRLYFEPLTTEDVLEVLRKEQAHGELLGVIVQLGGQTPLKLAHEIEEAGINVLGTPTDSIDLSEDRERFKQLIDKLGLKQPENDTASSVAEAVAAAQRIGFPVVIRPSYVIGGQAMRIVETEEDLHEYFSDSIDVSNNRPVLIDKYLDAAIECDVDAIADSKSVMIAGVMEHIEPAGIHSGDSACCLPPYSLDDEVVEEMRRQTAALAEALAVVGLVNVQFAVKDSEIYVIEVNPRASRTIPFVAKARGMPLAKFAAKVMAGTELSALGIPEESHNGLVAVKEAVLPFKRFDNTDIVLGPEMKSTGEVMGLGGTVEHAFARAQEAAGFELGRDGKILVISNPSASTGEKRLAGMLTDLNSTGVAVLIAPWLDDRPNGPAKSSFSDLPDADDLNPEEIALVLDPTAAPDPRASEYRQFALRYDIPYFTTDRSCKLALSVVLGGAPPFQSRTELQTMNTGNVSNEC